MFRFPRRPVLAVAGVTTALVLAGCSGEEAAPEPGPQAPPPAAVAGLQVSAEFNEADVAFATEMIPHHQQAVDMAALAVEKSGDEKVKALALKIRDAQDAEMAQLSGMLEVWGQQPPEDPGLDHGGHSGMVTDAEMMALESATGAEFDRKFVELMTRHHEGAVRVADGEKANGKNPQAKDLAGKISQDQQAELAELKSL
ncbi:DUF305 domain-containing protein [Amycolatopsis magusensis]|uniref:Uncharacterized protein (DUF305 family) n=1 Tax=Amycolatopsis magusensis TaxID=882444 RepID=A0ABS4PRA9_9PSEU|nr:DUF305 domain-containing protein [Amycolatopsis magusensis]MBP2181960.1 uncharacterized protein (DUF305 family) [Amycolatopsis magusensis]